jgi:uncharacterized SAM-binding protein YcdF (DUF218 family)
MSSLLVLLAIFACLTATLLPRPLQLFAAVLALALFGFGLLSPVERESLALRWLEGWHDRSRVTAQLSPRGIIVLGGGMAAYRVDYSTGASLDTRGRSGRISAAGELARAYTAAKVVYAGRGEGPVADVLSDLDIQRDRIVVEDSSATTYENARNTANLLSPKPGEMWILITSASHMPRAVATFATAGFNVVPFPVDYRQSPVEASTGRSPHSLAERELAAMAWYIVTGRISLKGLYRSLPRQ